MIATHSRIASKIFDCCCCHCSLLPHPHPHAHCCNYCRYPIGVILVFVVLVFVFFVDFVDASAKWIEFGASGARRVRCASSRTGVSAWDRRLV